MISGSKEQLQQQFEYTLLKPDCHSWWTSKMQSEREDILEEWASRQFLSLPIVQTLLPETFGYSLSSEPVVIRQLRRWKRLWRRSLTRSHKRTSMGLPEVVGTVQQANCNRRRLLRKGLECVLSIKVTIWKKSWNIFNDPRIFKRKQQTK